MIGSLLEDLFYISASLVCGIRGRLFTGAYEMFSSPVYPDESVSYAAIYVFRHGAPVLLALVWVFSRIRMQRLNFMLFHFSNSIQSVLAS